MKERRRGGKKGRGRERRGRSGSNKRIAAVTVEGVLCEEYGVYLCGPSVRSQNNAILRGEGECRSRRVSNTQSSAYFEHYASNGGPSLHWLGHLHSCSLQSLVPAFP